MQLAFEIFFESITRKIKSISQAGYSINLRGNGKPLLEEEMAVFFMRYRKIKRDWPV